MMIVVRSENNSFELVNHCKRHIECFYLHLCNCSMNLHVLVKTPKGLDRQRYLDIASLLTKAITFNLVKSFYGHIICGFRKHSAPFSAFEKILVLWSLENCTFSARCLCKPKNFWWRKPSPFSVTRTQRWSVYFYHSRMRYLHTTPSSLKLLSVMTIYWYFNGYFTRHQRLSLITFAVEGATMNIKWSIITRTCCTMLFIETLCFHIRGSF